MWRGVKIAAWIVVVPVALLVVGGGVGYAYVEATYERDFSATPLPAIVASTDPEVIARGEYVVHALAHCSACHGPAEKASQHQLGAKTDLRGGFTMAAGPFGTFFPSNLTSDPETGVGKLSDGQLARAVRYGIDHHGRFAAFMRLAVGPMSDEDLTAVMSYVRTLPPVRNEVPADRWGFIAKALAGSFGPRSGPVPAHVAAGEEPVVACGEYLANGPAACAACHTQLDPFAGFAVAGVPFAGNPEPEPDPTDAAFEFVVPNLTPDPETGVIASWSEDAFVARLAAGPAHKGSKMPWLNFQQMTDGDRRSIYRYLKSLPPTRSVTGPSRRPAGWRAEG